VTHGSSSPGGGSPGSSPGSSGGGGSPGSSGGGGSPGSSTNSYTPLKTPHFLHTMYSYSKWLTSVNSYSMV
jgi:hypothetical protein